MQRVWVLNGDNITYDHDLAMLFLWITDWWIVEWWDISNSKIQPLKAAIPCLRTNGQKLLLSFESDEQIDISSVEWKIYVEVSQNAIDNWEENNENWTWIAQITIWNSWPTKNFVKLYSISSWVITDERHIEPKLSEINWLKTRMTQAEADIAELQVAWAADHLEDRGLVWVYYDITDPMFNQKTAKYEDSTVEAKIWDVAADTELHIQRLWSWVESNKLKLKVKMWWSPTTSLIVEVRKWISVINQNKKKSYRYWDSNNVIASATLPYTTFSSSWQDLEITLDNSFWWTEWELLDVVVYQQSHIVNASNYYIIGCDSTQQSDAYQYLKVNWSTIKESGDIPYCISDWFADWDTVKVLSRVMTTWAYWLPRNLKNIWETARLTTLWRHTDWTWLDHKDESNIEYIHWWYKTFTIKWSETSTPASAFVDYEDDLEWMTKWDAATLQAIYDFIWFKWVRLNSAWKETAEIDLTNMSWESGLTSWDNVMVKFPLRWIKMTKSWSTCTLSITNNPNAEDEWFQYYAHSRWTLSNPIKKNAFYMWVYEWSVASSVLKSLSWATVYTKDNWNATMWDFINFARANDGNDWTWWYDIVWFYQRQYINALYMLIYWHLSSQTAIWNWITSWSKQTSWWSNSQSGHTYWTTANSTTAMKFLWIENRWWNVSEWLWWMCTDWSKNLWTALQWFVGDIKTQSPYENTWTTITTTSWNCLSSIAWNNKAMFAPIWTVNNSNYNTYYSDGVGVNASCLAHAGGSYGYGAYAGGFYLSVYDSASYSNADVGSRLMFL